MMSKPEWDALWEDIERTATPEVIAEPEREAREAREAARFRCVLCHGSKALSIVWSVSFGETSDRAEQVVVCGSCRRSSRWLPQRGRGSCRSATASTMWMPMVWSLTTCASRITGELDAESDAVAFEGRRLPGMPEVIRTRADCTNGGGAMTDEELEADVRRDRYYEWLDEQPKCQHCGTLAKRMRSTTRTVTSISAIRSAHSNDRDEAAYCAVERCASHASDATARWQQKTAEQ